MDHFWYLRNKREFGLINDKIDNHRIYNLLRSNNYYGRLYHNLYGDFRVELKRADQLLRMGDSVYLVRSGEKLYIYLIRANGDELIPVIEGVRRIEFVAHRYQSLAQHNPRIYLGVYMFDRRVYLFAVEHTLTQILNMEDLRIRYIRIGPSQDQKGDLDQ